MFGEVVKKRLSVRLGQLEIFPSSFGLTLVVLVDSPMEAEVAIADLAAALSKPINTTDIDDRSLDQARVLLGPSSPQSAGEVAIADCSGELFIDQRQTEVIRNPAKLREAVERARSDVYSQSNARFAVVGSRSIVRGAERALDKLQPWPRLAAANDVSPEVPSNSPNVSVSMGSARSLSIAWRVGSIATANFAALALRRTGSPLLSQVTALDTGWKLEAISAIARDMGACLRIDFSSDNDGATTPPMSLESVTRLAIAESRTALQAAAGTSLDDRDLALDNDPRRASRQVAWNSLSLPEPSTRRSMHVHLRISTADPQANALEAALHDALNKKGLSPIDAAFRLETGQTELWSVLASPCGTSNEATDDAGSTAAWIRAIAQQYTGHLGVQVEPWITSDGLGFIAHGPVQFSTETATSMATRLGNALGSVIATGRITGAELAAIRESSLLRVGSTPRRGYWQLIDSLSSGHSAAFEPLGTFDSIRGFDLSRLQAMRQAWLRGPLRLGTLLNRNKDQLTAMSASLHRWLDPHRPDLGQCPQMVVGNKPGQDIQITTRSIDQRDSNAYVAVQLAPDPHDNVIYEHWLLWLLTRPNGWLETNLHQAGGLTSFTADIKGPSHNRLLIVGLNGDDDSKLANCIVRLRDLLSRLSKQGAEAQEVELAKAWSEDQIRRAELDPRRRLVDLWRGTQATHQRHLSGFSRYLNQSLASASVTVLRIHRQP